MSEPSHDLITRIQDAIYNATDERLGPEIVFAKGLKALADYIYHEGRAALGDHQNNLWEIRRSGADDLLYDIASEIGGPYA